MANKIEIIDSIISKHFAEASAGLVDKAPSALARGEATEKNYFILKLDLVGSTQLLLKRKKETYLKFAHTFLSTVDKITQDFGADANQVEYAGDSVLSYFPSNSTTAEAVIQATCLSKIAIERMENLDGALGSIRFRCRAVLHYAPLLVARIGPRGNAILSAIGNPLHLVSKIEKRVPMNMAFATEKFYSQVAVQSRHFLNAIYEEKKIPISPIASPPFNPAIYGLFTAPPPKENLNVLGSILQPQPQYRTEQKLEGYSLDWGKLFPALNLLG
jgi:class 3 adenylate cyclase